MSGPLHLQLNGKFLAAAPTGVHRVAQELGNALSALIAEGHPACAGLTLEVLAPYDGMARARAMAMPARLVGPFRHIPWEQLTLPTRRGRGLLLNLCNIGPVIARNAVTMIHDAQVLLSPASYRRAFRAWYRLTQPLIARRHRLLLTVSDFSRHELASAGLAPLARIAVVHNGVDHVLAVPACPDIVGRLGLNAHRYVLALANTQAHKNVGVLLRAFAGAELAALKLVLFGGATAADFATQGHSVPDNVIFAGKISDGEVRALMEGALCLGFPSTTEGFGLPPLEAMLLGCPALVAPCGALPEVCGDAAVYVAPHDPAAWAGAVAALAGDEAARRDLAERGRQRAEKFTWRAAALTLAGVLRTC
jgi:glycosyltransferase involved in cell wall biosynthesis